MASNGNGKGGLLTAGGILSIIAGALEVIGGVLIWILPIGTRILIRMELLPLRPGTWFGHIIPILPMWLILLGGFLFVLGVVAIVGGVSATRRESFGLSLAGAICALPANILGILAVIFVSLSKKEFEAGK
jgi:hypothetical protein